jgi:sodium/potassium-transporting ATPase subunit alpha
LKTKFRVDFNPDKPSHSAGLGKEEHLKRYEDDGPNVLSPPKKTHPLLIFVGYLLHLFNLMLWVSGIIAYIIYAIDPPNNFPNVRMV